MERDLYEILGVSGDADTAAIKKAYRKLARKYHPDVNPDDAQAEERFKQVSTAFEVLGDPEKRKLYDEFGLDGLREGFDAEQARKYKQWQGAGGGGFGGGQRAYRSAGGADFQDLFGDLFGGGRAAQGSAGFGGGFGGFGGQAQSPVKGRDVTARLALDFRQAIEGGEMELAMQGRPLKVRVPKGVRDGERLRLKGKGGAAPQTPYGKGQPGDLLLEISVRPHPRVRREELDLYLDVPITIGEAIEGTQINVPTPWGNFKVTVPDGVNSGAKLRLKGQGVKRGKKQGNFYVVIQIHTPDHIDDELRKMARTMDDAYDQDLRGELSWN